MAYERELKPCSHPQKDCAACHEGLCLALYDTEFKGKTCPFYMDKETKRRVEGECRARLLESGYILKKRYA